MTTILIDQAHIGSVVNLLKANNVKHMPITRHGDEYTITLEDSPIASFLRLRYTKL